MRLLLLALAIQSTDAMAVGGSLGRALGKKAAKTVIVHLFDRNPAELESYAIDEVSIAARNAGATAVLCAPSLVKAIADEQEVHRGSFPGPVPVIADCALTDLKDSADASELVAGAKSLGAKGIGIRYYLSDWESDAAALEEALKTAVAAASEADLASVLLAEFGADGAEGAAGAGGMAASVGATAALSTDVAGDGVSLGCWDGSPVELQRLRDAGFNGVIVKDICRGNVGAGARVKSPSIAAQMVTRATKNAKASGNTKIWGGAAGGGFVSEATGADPDMETYFNRG